MKKKTSISTKSIASRPAAMKMNFNGKNWEASDLTEAQLERLLRDIEIQGEPGVPPIGVKYPLAIHPGNLSELAADGSARIVVVVAEKLVYKKGNETATFKMEAGRIAAQAAHVVSKLKMKYIYHNQDEKFNASSLAFQLGELGITTIVLGARDNYEVAHVAWLAEKAKLLHVIFADDNEQAYGTSDRITTAVAIGPLSKGSFAGISDYLPLYKAAGEA